MRRGGSVARRVPLGLVAGALFAAGMPPRRGWLFAVVGAAVLSVALQAARWRRLLVGAAAGAALYVPAFAVG